MISRAERSVVSFVAASAVLALPIKNRVMTALDYGEGNMTPEAYVTVWVVVVIMVACLALSVWIASRRESKHWLECLLDGAGIPSILIAVLVGIQSA